MGGGVEAGREERLVQAQGEWSQLKASGRMCCGPVAGSSGHLALGEGSHEQRRSSVMPSILHVF